MMRLLVYLAATFAISWGCWGGLILGLPPGGAVTGSRVLKSLYLLGGLGPAIGAILAVWATPGAGDPKDYLARLTRWRVAPIWWLAVLGLPVAFAAGKEWVAVWADGAAVHPASLVPLSRAALLLPSMIIGGGLEELGWRGVAQPSLERRTPRLGAALIVGAVWALWHLPLFLLPGAPQSGRNFPLFAADVVANACLLAWVYARTRSILLCILFHALGNMATALGLLAIGPPAGAAWVAVGAKFAAAVLLLTTAPRRAPVQVATS
jgi:membrane protease YdiL (CAAX protease family)